MSDLQQARLASSPIVVPVRIFARDYLAAVAATRPSSAYVRTMTALNRLMRLPGVVMTADLTASNLGRIVGNMMAEGRARNTILTEIKELHAAFDDAIGRGYLRENPAESLARLLPDDYAGSDDRRAVRWRGRSVGVPDAKQVTALMIRLRADSVSSWEGHRLYALAAIIVLAGLRSAEARWLESEDCLLDEGEIKVRGRQTAPAKQFRIMPPKLAEILLEWLPRTGCEYVCPGSILRGPWQEGYPGKKPIDRIRAAGEAVGIHRLTFEGLRGFWVEHQGRPHAGLGAGFMDVPEPARTYDGPRPGRPGPKPSTIPATKPRAAGTAAPSCQAGPPPALVLRGPHEPPIVRGVAWDRTLTEAEHKVLKLLRDHGCSETVRLSDKQIVALYGRPGDPLRTLRTLRKNPPFDSIILNPGTKGWGGTGLATR